MREKLDPCSIWGFPEAASSLLGLTDEMARKVFCHFHFHFLHISYIIESGRDADFTPVLVEDDDHVDIDADDNGGCEDDESGVGIKMAIPPSELGHVPRISSQQTNRHSTCTPPLPPPLHIHINCDHERSKSICTPPMHHIRQPPLTTLATDLSPNIQFVIQFAT